MKKVLVLALMAGISIALARIDLSSQPWCGEPDAENICWNDSECEPRFVEEYTNYFRQFYPEPWEIGVDVWAACPYGTCDGGMCENRYDIMVSLYNPITEEYKEIWNYNQLCETWGCY